MRKTTVLENFRIIKKKKKTTKVKNVNLKGGGF